MKSDSFGYLIRLRNSEYLFHMGKVIIRVDYRERRSRVPSLLDAAGFLPVYQKLEAGDYLIGERYVIERKTANDFLHSLYDRRLFDQCRRLNRLHQVPLLILEGNPFITGSRISRNALNSTLLSVSASWLIPVIQTKNEVETAEVIGKLFHLQVLNRKRPAPQFRNRLLKKDDLVSFVSGIPGLGTSKAKAMLAHFRSVKELIKASKEEWVMVPGIGSGIASSLEEFLNRPYKNQPDKKG